MSDRIARAFNRLSTEFGMLVFLTTLSLSEKISGQIFGLISSFLSNRQLCVVLDGKSSEEYPVNAVVSQGSILGPTLFLLYTNDFPDMLSVILISMLMMLLSTPPR